MIEENHEKAIQHFAENSYEILITTDRFESIETLLNVNEIKIFPYKVVHPSQVFKPEIAELFKEKAILSLFIENSFDFSKVLNLISNIYEWKDIELLSGKKLNFYY